MPRSADDIARLKEAQGSHNKKSSCVSSPLDQFHRPQDCPQPCEAPITTSVPTAGSSCGRVNSVQHASPTALSSIIPAKRSSSAFGTGALTCGPRAASPGLRAASWGTGASSWSTAFNGSDQLFSPGNCQARPTPATEGSSVQSVQSPEAGWDPGWDQLVPVSRVGDSSSYCGSSPTSSGVLPVISPDSSFVAAAPGGYNNDHLFGTSWGHNTMAGQGHNSAAGLHDVLIPLVGSLVPTTTTATSTAAMLSPAPAQQQQTAWGSPADLHTLLQLQLSLAAAEHAAASPAAAASGPLDSFNSAGCLASSSSLLGMYSAGLAAPGPVLESGSFTLQQPQQQQHCLPDGLASSSLALPFNSTPAQAQLPPGLELDSLSVCCAGSSPLPGGSSSLLAALQGSSGASRPLTHQCVVGNGVAAAAAAVAQDKLAQM